MTGAGVMAVRTGVVSAFGWSRAALPDWYEVIRGAMMGLGGLVVVGLMLIVMVAVVSGLAGMIGKLKKRN